MNILYKYINQTYESETTSSAVSSILRETTGELSQERLVRLEADSRYSLSALFDGSDPDLAKGEVLSISPAARRPVIGIDASTIPVAESGRGTLVACRGTRVGKDESGHFDVYRTPSLLVYLTPATLTKLATTLRLPASCVRTAIYDLGTASELALTAVEQALLIDALYQNDESLVLLDGALTNWEIRLRDASIERGLTDALRRKNSLLGVSKRSKLFKEKYAYLRSLASDTPPLAVDVEHKKSLYDVVESETYFVRLSAGGNPLRIDVASREEADSVLGVLASSDSQWFGYPEVLREAHILSKFSTTEKTALRASLSEHGAKLLTAHRARDVFFGPFNATEEEGV